MSLRIDHGRIRRAPALLQRARTNFWNDRGVKGAKRSIAQSMGLPGQPEHPEVLAAQARVADRIRDAGDSSRVDVTAWIYLPEPIVDGAQRFLADHT